MKISVAIEKIKAYFRKYWRFRFIDVDEAGEAISVTGVVLTKTHKKEARKHAESVWTRIILNVTEMHYLFLAVVLLVDSAIFYLGVLCILHFPKDNVLLAIVHDACVIVLMLVILVHAISVLWLSILSFSEKE